MSSAKFILKGLDGLAKEFPLIKLSYQFDDNTDTHFVEVLPKEFFEKYDPEFISGQNTLILNFIQDYPNESLAFITQDDFFVVSKPCHIAVGELFEEPKAVQWSGIELSEMLNTHQADIKAAFTFDQEIHVKSNVQSSFEFSFESLKEIHSAQAVTNNLPTTSFNSNEMGYDSPINLMLAA